jgi:hypothetical protein
MWLCLLLKLGLPEQGFPIGLGLVVEDKSTEFSCTKLCTKFLGVQLRSQ